MTSHIVSPMNIRTIAQVVALSRVAFGVGMLAAPARIGAGWIGPTGEGAPASVLARSVASRDIGLGLGALAATRSGGGEAWFAAHALADATDVLGTLAARDSLPAGGVKGTLALGGGSMLACAACAVALARD